MAIWHRTMRSFVPSGKHSISVWGGANAGCNDCCGALGNCTSIRPPRNFLQDYDGGTAAFKAEPWVRDFALKPQERAFKPGQLSQLMDFLAGKGEGSWDPGGDGDSGEWLLRLFSSCPPLPNAANSLTARCAHPDSSS